MSNVIYLGTPRWLVYTKNNNQPSKKTMSRNVYFGIFGQLISKASYGSRAVSWTGNGRLDRAAIDGGAADWMQVRWLVSAVDLRLTNHNRPTVMSSQGG